VSTENISATDARAPTGDRSSFVLGFFGNPVLRAATGRTFVTHVAEVWNLPSTIAYPVLAVNLESKNDPVRGAAGQAAFSKYILRFWYVTDGSMLEAMKFRDALQGLLHLQMASLESHRVYVGWIECTSSRVFQLTDVEKHQAYLQFSVIA
jgi:hypothetical protein